MAEHPEDALLEISAKLTVVMRILKVPDDAEHPDHLTPDERGWDLIAARDLLGEMRDLARQSLRAAKAEK